MINNTPSVGEAHAARGGTLVERNSIVGNSIIVWINTGVGLNVEALPHGMSKYPLSEDLICQRL